MDNKKLSYKRAPIPLKERVLRFFADSDVSMSSASIVIFGDFGRIARFINEDHSLEVEFAFLKKMRIAVNGIQTLRVQVNLFHDDYLDPFLGSQQEQSND